jgi:hypothetical protein
MNGVIGQVEDIYPKGGVVGLDRGGSVQWLEGVRELEDERSRLREVLDSALGWVVGADPAEVSAIARLKVRRSCRRATLSWPVILGNRGERISTLRPKAAGAEASRRK